MRDFEHWETETRGECLGPEWQNCVAVVNPNIQPHAGDVVCVWVIDQATRRPHTILKYLEATRDGRWWLQCFEGTVPINAYFVPGEIRPVIGRYDLRGPSRAGDHTWRTADIVASRAVIQQWDELSLDARAEWASLGKVRPAIFPGIEAALAAGNPATSWPESFRLPDHHFVRRAFA